jgi:tetratricopeptide (TPR) repeat protein
MAEEPNPNNPKIIKLEGNAQDQSKLTQVGSIEAENVNLTTDHLQIIVHLERSTKVESPGVLKAGNFGKSLAYWQGRETEIAQIQQWLTDKNTFLIGIEGIGGIGKSMLATKIYDEIEGFTNRFGANVSNGVSFSDLARQVLGEFGFPIPEQEVQLVEALVKCLRSGQFLLIIDNLESLLQPDRQWGSLFYGEFFQAWIESGANSKVLVTTRERPELRGFEWLPLKGLQLDEGVALLSELGIRGDLAEFVKLVDGHPLLLKLVADLLREEYPQDPDLQRLADLGLGNLRQLLTDPQVVGVHHWEKNVGMVLVLDASFNRLNELQKALLLNISVYRGAFDSAAAVAMLPGNSESEIEKELKNLVKRSLLEEKLNGKQPFEFQPVVSEYLRYKAGNQTQAHQRAINYYILNVKQKPWQTKEDIKEYLEIFYHWYQLENYECAFNILCFCDNFLTLRGYYTDQVDLYGQLIAAWEKTGDRENGRYMVALISLGNTYKLLGEYQLAIEFNQQSLHIARKIGNCDGESSSLIGLGSSYYLLENLQGAIECYQQSLYIARETGHREVEGRSLMGLGNVYDYVGNFLAAIDCYEQSLNIAREISDHNTEGKSLMNLGGLYLDYGQYPQAIEFLQQSLEISTDIGDIRGQANTWFNLGLALEKVNRETDAIGAYRNAWELFQKMRLYADVQNCNNAIERLSQPKTPVVSRRGFWWRLRQLWRWVRSWFGR